MSFDPNPNNPFTNPNPVSPINLVTAAANPVLTNKLLVGDANPAFRINGDGTISWGPGGAAALDATLSRNGAGRLSIAGAGGLNASVFSAPPGGAQVQIGTVGPGGLSGITFQNTEAGSNLYRTAAGLLKIDGSLDLGVGLRVVEGANARMGVATLVAGTVTIANTSVTANTRVFVSDRGAGGANLGSLAENFGARVAGTSFRIDSTNALDTSTFNWLLIEPG